MRIWMMIFAMALIACDKKDTHNDPYYTDYKEGQEYAQTFFSSKINQNSPSQNYTINIVSIDNRIWLMYVPSDSPLAPQNLTKPNLEETDDLKLYQVADFRFIYKGKGSMEEIYTKIKDWHWVYGREVDYKFPDGSVHQRIEIVSEIE